ncbi:CoA-binding protein [Guggenheimella bovis]
MKELIANALNEKRWAVLGATDKKDRFGYKILKRLIDLDYDVTPINPNYEEILGKKAYKNLKDVPEAIDVVDVVVNKELVRKWIESDDLSCYKYIWFQPHTYDEEIIELAKAKNSNLIYDHCVLIETNK